MKKYYDFITEEDVNELEKKIIQTYETELANDNLDDDEDDLMGRIWTHRYIETMCTCAVNNVYLIAAWCNKKYRIMDKYERLIKCDLKYAHEIESGWLGYGLTSITHMCIDQWIHDMRIKYELECNRRTGRVCYLV